MEENPLEWKAIRILEDAGCDEETVRRYCELEAYQGRQSIACKEQIRLLRKHRRLLMDQLHRCQQQLDCLDYLLYRMREAQVIGGSR